MSGVLRRTCAWRRVPSHVVDAMMSMIHLKPFRRRHLFHRRQTREAIVCLACHRDEVYWVAERNTVCVFQADGLGLVRQWSCGADVTLVSDLVVSDQGQVLLAVDDGVYSVALRIRVFQTNGSFQCDWRINPQWINCESARPFAGHKLAVIKNQLFVSTPAARHIYVVGLDDGHLQTHWDCGMRPVALCVAPRGHLVLMTKSTTPGTLGVEVRTPDGVLLQAWCTQSQRLYWKEWCSVAVRDEEILVTHGVQRGIWVYRLDGTLLSAWMGLGECPVTLATTRRGHVIVANWNYIDVFD